MVSSTLAPGKVSDISAWQLTPFTRPESKLSTPAKASQERSSGASQKSPTTRLSASQGKPAGSFPQGSSYRYELIHHLCQNPSIWVQEDVSCPQFSFRKNREISREKRLCLRLNSHTIQGAVLQCLLSSVFPSYFELELSTTANDMKNRRRQNEPIQGCVYCRRILGYPCTKPGCFGHTPVSTRVSLCTETWLFRSYPGRYSGTHPPEYTLYCTLQNILSKLVRNCSRLSLLKNIDACHSTRLCPQVKGRARRLPAHGPPSSNGVETRVTSSNTGEIFHRPR